MSEQKTKLSLAGLDAASFESTIDGKNSWQDYLGKPLVVYFYPKDNTPGCTTESKEFAAQYSAFQSVGCDVVGISRDSIASHSKFSAKLSLPFALISDADESICRQFDVLGEKKMFGKVGFGIIRSTFLFDAKGICQQIWSPVKVSGHVDSVLSAAQSL